MNSYLEIAMHNRRIPLVDYLKGFSILVIILVHLLEIMPKIPGIVITMSAAGGGGVHVFLLCSGFGLYFSHLHHKKGYAEFIKTRFLKIYIPYIVIVILSALLPWMYQGNEKIAALLSHIFLYKMFIPRFNETFGVHFWFVSTLFQFYAAFIPMCRAREKLGSSQRFFWVISGIGALWWLFTYFAGIAHIRIWGSFFLQYLWEFALGFVLAEAFYNGKSFRIKNWQLLAVAIVGIGLQAGLVLISDSLRIINDVPGLIGFGSLALFLSNISLLRTLCIKLAAVSYELYLVHLLILRTVFHFARPQEFLPGVFWALAATALSIAAACLYNRIIRRVSAKRVRLTGTHS